MRKLIIFCALLIALFVFAKSISAQTYCDPGERRCSSRSYYQECGDNFRWGSSTYCGDGKYCSGGYCYSSCTCSGSGTTCSGGDAYQCNGCNWTLKENCNDSTEHCDSGSCVANESATDECSAGDFKCSSDGKTLLGCKVGDPNVWSSSEPYADYCSFGCDTSKDPDECTAVNSYCVNIDACGEAGCDPDYQRVWCWDSYGAYEDDLKDDNDANSPATDECLKSCSITACHPTENWCVGNESPCPVSSMPGATEKWLDNCGGIDCKVPTTTSCGGSSPSPTATPVPTAPRCDAITLSVSPTTPVAGSLITFTATTTSTNYLPDDAVERVEFLIDTGVSSVQITDATAPYTATYTPADATGLTVTATGLFSVAGSTPCTTTQTYSPEKPPFQVTLQAYEVPVNSACDNDTPLSDVIPTVTIGTDTLSVSPTNLAGQTSFTGFGGNTYRIGMYKTDYVPQCGITYQNPRDLSLGYLSDPPVQNFYFTRQAEAWYQIVNGDAGAKGGDISVNIPSNQFFFMPNSEAAGVPIASKDVEINGQGKLNEFRSYLAERTDLAGPPTNGWYGYFDRTFDQLFDGSDVTTLSDANFMDVDWEEHNDESESYVLYLNGSNSLTIDGPITVNDVNDGKKYTVFVPGNLFVDADISVNQGSFLGFVVRGSITFSEDTKSIDGVYISDSNLVVEDNIFPFHGNGTFVGMGQVNLYRDLKTATDTLANNTQPAEKFTYRPDLLYNAPVGFKRIPLQWQEIEPTGTNP